MTPNTFVRFVVLRATLFLNIWMFANIATTSLTKIRENQSDIMTTFLQIAENHPNHCNSTTITEHQRKSMRTNENQKRFVKINEYQRKSLKIHEHQ